MGWFSATTETIESPCIGVCTLDDQGVCMGCHRTDDQIARWVEMDTEERSRIMQELAVVAQPVTEGVSG